MKPSENAAASTRAQPKASNEVVGGARTAMDRQGRLARLATAMAEAEVDGFWVTKPVNVRWLTGFTGSNGRILATATSDGIDVLLVTDGRYRIQAADELAAAGLANDVEVFVGPSPVAAFAGRNMQRLGFESHHLSVDGLAELKTWTSAASVAISGAIEDARWVKDEGERERLATAAAIADSAWSEMLGCLTPGITERSFARRLDNAMLDAGADGISFETIVAAGANSARPHHRPGDTVMAAGDLVVMDFGASVDGYGSDMTRTVVLGAEPTQRQAELYAAVQESQAAGVAAVRAGVEQRSIDTACRSVLETHGLGDAFIHGTGHSIGLEIHEQPILSARSVGILPAGLVVTVEPGAYIAGFGGVRIEDSVVVTATGCSPITTSPKGLTPY